MSIHRLMVKQINSYIGIIPKPESLLMQDPGFSCRFRMLMNLWMMRVKSSKRHRHLSVVSIDIVNHSYYYNLKGYLFISEKAVRGSTYDAK